MFPKLEFIRNFLGIFWEFIENIFTYLLVTNQKCGVRKFCGDKPFPLRFVGSQNPNLPFGKAEYNYFLFKLRLGGMKKIM